jgi:hypothetical protein
MPALTLQNNDGPPLFVNSNAFMNTARLHTHVPLECSRYNSYQHWRCVWFERSAALLSVWTLHHQCMRCSHSPSCLQTPMALFHSVILCSTLCSTLCSHSPSCLQTPMAPGTALSSRLVSLLPQPSSDGYEYCTHAHTVSGYSYHHRQQSFLCGRVAQGTQHS